MGRIGRCILVFLLGTSVVSGHVLRNHHADMIVEPKSLYSHLPVFQTMPKELMNRLPYLVQQGTNLYYKPQFLVPFSDTSSPITTILREKDCKKDIKEETKPEIVVDNHKNSEAPIFVEIIPSTPDLPNIIEVLQTPEFKPIDIPEPPRLPEPETSINPEDFEVFPAPTSQWKPIEVPEIIFPAPVHPKIEPSFDHKPVEVPEPPRLPELVLIVPEDTENLPVLNLKPSEIPDTPKLSPMEPIVPVIHEIIEIQPVESKPFDIPKPPRLPELIVNVSEAMGVVSEPESKPLFSNDQINAIKPCYQKPVDIPEPPRLPEFNSPEFKPTIPDLVDLVPALETKPFEIPEPPKLPPMESIIPVLPEIIEIQPTIEPKPFDIPTPPKLPELVMPEFEQIVPEAMEILTLPESKPLDILEPSKLLQNQITEIEPSHQKPVVIPEPPRLPEFVMPEFKPIVPEFIELHPEPEIKPFEVPEPPKILSMLIEIPAKVEYQQFVEIPEPPKLPEFIMPAQLNFEESPKASCQYNEPVQTSESPEPPRLSFMPKFETTYPSLVEESKTENTEPAAESNRLEIPEPRLPEPEMSLNEINKQFKPFNNDNRMLIEESIVAIPEIPQLSPIFVPEIDIRLPEEVNIATEKHFAIPDAPTLSPFIIPDFTKINVEDPVHIQPDIPQPKAIEERPLALKEIPIPPVLPPFEITAIPVLEEDLVQLAHFESKHDFVPEPPTIGTILLEKDEAYHEDEIIEYKPTKHENPILPTLVIPEIPFDSRNPIFFPTLCAQNIIIERYVPNVIVSDKMYTESFKDHIRDPVFASALY